MLADPPIRNRPGAQYGTVIAAYCAESATSDQTLWRSGMTRIAQLVEPGGLMRVAALDRACRYGVGTDWFPSAEISADDLHRVLEEDFDPATIMVRRHPALLDGSKGYTGVLQASAIRQPAKPAGQT